MLRPPPPETEAEAEAEAEVVAADMEAAPPPVITPEVDEDAIEGSFSAIPSPACSTFRQFITQFDIWGDRSIVRRDHCFICDTTFELQHDSLSFTL